MRDDYPSTALAAEADTLLTTGEAAKLLGASRQHVVNLCNRGDLPFVTVGRHRRIRRSDLEAHRSRSARLSRDQQRSLWLAFAVAGEITRDPAAILEAARHNLERMRPKTRGSASQWLDEWDRLLRGPVLRLLTVMTSPSPKGRELRQNNPFAGVLTDLDRTGRLAELAAQR